MFGDQGSTKLNNKRSVQLFVKFLSDLVPYEPAEYLKVHIIKAPLVPSKLREHVTDYVSLAKTRLMDLQEPVELMAMYGDSSGTSGMDVKSDHTKQVEQASADVEKVLESYEKSGKVPSTVMEASIFRKPYFIGRFLPALLTPRKVPEEPDVRAQLIDVLIK
ncbi:Fanconi anemia group A protein-like [Orbicella faveolata]|uniref:Fanconi anemia group A protein-like n=1 Tax=Orbicella faveolata TaxID=48498 RepID=UPI0009E3D355|nr:Fanconi anemia group A protein-like [Orbicella faveolata]